MDSILNGPGPFVAISALPMLIGLFLREGALARQLRRIAFWLALLLPAIFMLLAAIFLAKSSNVFFDFSVNYDAAQALYGHGTSPYAIRGAYSFPFPTFFLYWLASGFGNLSKPAAWIVWWIANAAIWLYCVLRIWGTLPKLASRQGRDVLRYCCVAIPAAVTIWQGQTALLILLGLVELHAQVVHGRELRHWMIGGAGLTWAILLKPQLALIGIGIVVWVLLKQRDYLFKPVPRIILGAGISALLLIGLTLILPGGVTLETYQHFFIDALPKVAQPGDSITVIGSPAFVTAVIANQLGASTAVADLLSTLVTLIVLAFAILWTVQRRDGFLGEIVMGWAVWAMVAPRVTWTWYATWCLPYFLFEAFETTPPISDNSAKIRLALIIIVLALLNLQLASIPMEAVTILLLIFLLWTGLKRSYDI